MKYNIRGENVEATEAIKDYVEKKVGKLERYFDSPVDSEVHVNLSVHNNASKIEVTIPMKNLLLRAEESHADLYAAIDLVVTKLERQIKKHKTKVNRRSRQSGDAPKHAFAALENESAASAVVATNEDEEDLDSFEIVRNKRFDLKPMDSEEAILQMDMLGHSFFVYTNSVTGDTNVVYKRKDGRYGLIEPS
ncbi:putative sigma-54 modulation protein [Terribacillus halophilus]|uniref:Ribosome hibernation promoting factor n=1 Tax=Terribacillus halophilus TaxID=361279 RepID=A0A1G6J073_9BACI|nr:ribosome-associated translation inhibitor RaiA [Terribacillus halophilus]SDC12184.1 putative sigma-54 modulation protein [Terribacillus halophilus]